MIVVALYGGLGNQMFQYAAARALALRNNQYLALDLSWYLLKKNPETTERKYLLDGFQIKAKIANESVLSKYKSTNSGSVFLQEKTYYKFDPILQKSFSNAYLNGYWQTEKYFFDYADKIRNEFRLRFLNRLKIASAYKDLIDDINSNISIGIHVRRGDYVESAHTNDHHGLCSQEYYVIAADLIGKWVGNPKFYVFSDDLNWCKSNLILPYPTEYIGGHDTDDPTSDFFLLNQCKHFITANSSFSWWSAWLADNPNKIVIAPKKLVRSDSIDTTDYFPINWIRI